MKNKKHKLVTHKWHRSRLIKNEIWYVSLEEAIEQAGKQICESWKIYDKDDVLVCSGPDQDIDSPYT
jgi:hypothetical protein